MDGANGQNEQSERLVMVYIGPRFFVGIDGGDDPDRLILGGQEATFGLLRRVVDMAPTLNQRTGELEIKGLLLGDMTYPYASACVCELNKDNIYRKAYYAIAANIHLA